jgi:hypothetical protein
MSVGEPRWSILASSAEQVEHFFQETIDNRCVLCSAVYFSFMEERVGRKIVTFCFICNNII